MSGFTPALGAARPVYSRTRRIRTVLLALCTLAIALLLVEGAARGLLWARERWSNAHRGGRPDVYWSVIHRLEPLRYELPPGRRVTAGGALAAVNADGLRGAAPERPKRRIRILCLGDSNTFGFAPDVTDEKTYPARLGALLEREAPGRFEVLNGGMPNYGTLDCLGYFLYRGVELKPDYVVMMVGWNEVTHSQHLKRPEEAPAPLEWSATARVIRGVLRRVGKPAEPAAAAGADRLSDEAFARYRRVLADLVELTRSHGARPVLVTLPNFARREWSNAASLTPREREVMEYHLSDWLLTPKGWYRFVDRTNTLIRQVAREQDVPLVEGAAIRDAERFVDVCHLDAKGNARLAELVLRRFTTPRAAEK